MTSDTTSTRTEDFTGIRVLRLTDERGDVRVRCSTSDGTARVHLVARGDVDLGPVELRADGGTLVVDVPALTDRDAPPGFTLRLGPLSVGSLTSASIPVDVEVDLPAGAEITARTRLGDITVEGESAAVSARTGSGDVRVENGDRVRLACGSGDAWVGCCRGGEVTTGAGDIEIDEAAGAGLHCRTGAGAVLVRHSRSERVSVVTGSGDVTVHLGAGTLDCRSGTGSVEAVLPRGVPTWLDLSSGTGRVTKDVDPVGAPRDGRSHLSVRVRTGVGDVTVRH